MTAWARSALLLWAAARASGSALDDVSLVQKDLHAPASMSGSSKLALMEDMEENALAILKNALNQFPGMDGMQIPANMTMHDILQVLTGLFSNDTQHDALANGTKGLFVILDNFRKNFTLETAILVEASGGASTDPYALGNFGSKVLAAIDQGVGAIIEGMFEVMVILAPTLEKLTALLPDGKSSTGALAIPGMGGLDITSMDPDQLKMLLSGFIRMSFPDPSATGTEYCSKMETVWPKLVKMEEVLTKKVLPISGQVVKALPQVGPFLQQYAPQAAPHMVSYLNMTADGFVDTLTGILPSVSTALSTSKGLIEEQMDCELQKSEKGGGARPAMAPMAMLAAAAVAWLGLR